MGQIIPQSPVPKLPMYHPSQAFALFYYLCAAYRKGQFSFRQYSNALKTLRFFDENKAIWTIGAGSGKWYRRAGDKWVRDEPSGQIVFTIQSAWHDYLRKMEQTGACDKCGAQLPALSRFCLNCGTPAQKSSASHTPVTKGVYCRNCGHELKSGARFCNNCGKVRQ
ncbi:zinc ribbon domain-containing protein [Dehalogenimonas sp. THU2]|uniref:zinc ribbon domain-containing protein n=1 Tax=Dehalogenimonas sp. THU2 TaxID=3151121 RepID=UPI0032185867